MENIYKWRTATGRKMAIQSLSFKKYLEAEKSEWYKNDYDCDKNDKRSGKAITSADKFSKAVVPGLKQYREADAKNNYIQFRQEYKKYENRNQSHHY